MRRLEAHAWKGNIAELRSVIERAVANAEGGALVDVPESLLRAETTLGSYTLMKPLGEGGMGSVWLAHHTLLSRPAAVKLISREAVESLGGTQDLARRFRREAEATAQLRSRHTVEIYDFGVSEEGAFYYVMERLHGMDLDSMIEQNGALPPERVVHFLIQVCRSLAEAHDGGLVHRDIKPANLFASSSPDFDFLKVLDFGLVTTFYGDEAEPVSGSARTMPDPRRFETMFSSGGAEGTPAFLAPEVVLNQQADGRSDLYSLGCSAFYLLEARPPFEARDVMGLLFKHVRDPPPELSPHVPVELGRVVQALMQKDPDERPATAEDVGRMLSKVPLRDPWTDQRARSWWEAL